MQSIVDFFEEIDLEKQGDIRDYLNKRMTYTEELPVPTKDTLYRVSWLNQLCPREECLCAKYGMVRQKEVEAKLARTFAFGRAFEKIFRDDKLGDLGIVIGKWRCLGCGYTPEDINDKTRYKKPLKCKKCGNIENGFSYVEEEIHNKNLLISGHPDGFIVWNNEHYILEMKTCSSWHFKTFRHSPKSDHVAQVMMYAWLNNYNKGVIWYFNKDTSEDAVHVVDMNKEVISYLLNKTKTISDFFEKGWMPGRICAGKEDARAVKCVVCEQCFAEGVPFEQEGGSRT